MENRAFRRDLKALRHELEELQEILEDLGESGGEAAKRALNEMKGRLEAKLSHIFNSLKDASHEAEGRGKSFFREAEQGGKRFMKRAEHRGKGAFYETNHDSVTRNPGVAASLAVFGLGFAVGWLFARR